MNEWEKSYYTEDLDHKGPSQFDTYNDFVEAQVEEIPEYLLVLLPYSDGEYAFKKIQLEWIWDFWGSRKKLES